MNTATKVGAAVLAIAVAGVVADKATDCQRVTLLDRATRRYSQTIECFGPEKRGASLQVVSSEPANAIGSDAFPCACSVGKSCEQLKSGKWVPAVLGITLEAGKWRGDGCLPKACAEVAGVSSWPKECPE